MDANRRPYQGYLFTIRLWQEDLDTGHSEWRGRLENTANGEVRYFRAWHVLARLLPAMLAEMEKEESFGEDD